MAEETRETGAEPKPDSGPVIVESYSPEEFASVLDGTLEADVPRLIETVNNTLESFGELEKQLKVYQLFMAAAILMNKKPLEISYIALKSVMPTDTVKFEKDASGKTYQVRLMELKPEKK